MARFRSTRLAVLGAYGAYFALWYRTRAKHHRVGSALPLSDVTRSARTAALAKVGATAGVRNATHQARRTFASADTRVRLDAANELKNAEQVAAALGQMKGVMMKLGQMGSFLTESIPAPMRAQLATLQADAPPMSAELTAEVIERELGQPPESLFAEWDPVPLASASIGQVHRAITHQGQAVAVKVQYPGVEHAIRADIDNTALLTQMLGLVFKGLDVRPFVGELRERIGEELDYGLEAQRQTRFHELYRGHPTIVVPAVHPRYSTARVLTSDLSAGGRFDTTASWDQRERDVAGETIYRFVFRTFNRHGLFNGDPHPGNYLFERKGPFGVQVTFLDFGLVKEFSAAEMATFQTMIRFQVSEPDPAAYRRSIEAAGLLKPGAPYGDDELMEYFGWFYVPVLRDAEFTYTKDYAAEALRRTFDLKGPHTELMQWFNLPPTFVVLNRIQWGLNAVLADLGATANWRRISDELWPWVDGPPATPIGEAEALWLAAKG